MLRKRTSSLLKDQNHKDQMAISEADYNVKSNSIFNAPLLFVGLGPKGVLDCDSVRSPTSPLDFTLVSNLGNPFRTPISFLHEGQQRSWDCSKVGLSIIDSLKDCSKFSGKILLSSENKKPSLTPQMIINTPNCKTYVDSVEASKSLPKEFCKLPYTNNGTTFHKGESTVLFEIGETLQEHEPFGKTRSCSLDSFTPIDDDLSGLTGSNTDSDFKNSASNQLSSPPHFIGGRQNSSTLLPIELTSNPACICSSNEFMKFLSASEIELSEDYTCVISHGPNPKTTHIFCDCILETHSNDFKDHCKNEEEEKGVFFLVDNRLQTQNQYPSSGFLSFCYRCNKKLEEGEDIYIYR